MTLSLHEFHQSLGARFSELGGAEIVADYGDTIAEYTALQMKQAVAGSGRAAKAEVQQMVKRLLQLPGLPGKDAADALGLALR